MLAELVCVDASVSREGNNAVVVVEAAIEAAARVEVVTEAWGFEKLATLYEVFAIYPEPGKIDINS